MKSTEIEKIITVELFTNMVNSLENRLDYTKAKNNAKYHNLEFNKSLSNDFKQITEVLQNVVDSFYLDYYEVNTFQQINLDNLDYSIKHNLQLINNTKKLIKFIN
jgi:hypothetical protein